MKHLAEAIRRYDLHDLETHAGAIYAVDADLRLGYFNPAWFRFARENGGEPAISRDWTLGVPLLDCIPLPLQPVYAPRLRRCLSSGEVWKHEYECSSATQYRRFHQIVYALDGAAGLLIVNSLVVDRPHDPAERPAGVPDEATYRDADGIICQCVHCRRTQHPSEVNRWDWVPQWVTQCPTETSHGFCGTCYRFYYPTGSGD